MKDQTAMESVYKAVRAIQPATINMIISYTHLNSNTVKYSLAALRKAGRIEAITGGDYYRFKVTSTQHPLHRVIWDAENISRVIQ